jgi:aminobenzoyl-glutamate utilization protein A
MGLAVMRDQVSEQVNAISGRIVDYRRDFHRFAESGWTEFRTASLVARRLETLGFLVDAGRGVIRDEDRMGLPPSEALEIHWQRAFEQGGDPEFLTAIRGGFTGVVATLQHGEGPVVGLRFDIDAVDIIESEASSHRPVQDGFASSNPGVMHACGHDGHTAVGLGVAEVLAAFQPEMHGTVKLIFQPAEEGVRGAKAMVGAGVVDDVDYLLGHHLYSGWNLREIDPGRSNYLATSKFDAIFTGAPAHAGGRPHEGKNALLAAATAVLNLHAIPRHKEGATRINVGRLDAGTGRNVICRKAHLVLETRGATTELDEYMVESSTRVLEAAAAMYGCSLEIKAMGGAQSGSSDASLASRVENIVLEMGGFSIRAPDKGGGSEDFTYMMQRVQERGGLATNIGIGANLGGWGHHTADFDFDEAALSDAIRLLCVVTLDLLGERR